MKQAKQKKNEFLVQVMITEVMNKLHIIFYQGPGHIGEGCFRNFRPIRSYQCWESASVGYIDSVEGGDCSMELDQNFTFSGLKMNDIEFENFEIKIEVYDQNEFLSNQLIGTHSIGLSTLYRNPNHEIFNKWLPILHPSQDLKPQGFLLVSAYIIGEHDRPPVHDANENKVEDEPDEFGGVPDDQLTGEQLQRRREKKKQLAIVTKPEMYTKSCQLMVNIVKAEDLPVLSFGSIDSFVSVRANSITQITGTFKNQQKPQFKTRMLFPIQFPINNEKILIRVWDKRVCMDDTFIAQIPEAPSENDFFNVSFLQSRGGVLSFRWFNLYGIPMDERPSNFEHSFLGYKKMAYGTSYMGRILISLNLTPSEKPEKGVQPLGIYREPPIVRYKIRLDVYEVSEARGCGEFVKLRVRVGGQYVDSERAYAPKEKKGNNKKQLQQKEEKKGDNVTYVWKDKDILVDMKPVEVTADPSQHPDIIIELYDETNKRVAYLRIPPFSSELTDERPKWYQLKEVKFKGDKSEPTQSNALLNIMFLSESTMDSLPRIPVKRNIKTYFIFHCYMYAGYDFCPDQSDDVLLEYDIKIGDKKHEMRQPIPGKNPLWNQLISIPLSLNENLQFASNIIITFYNAAKEPTIFSSNQKVGEICIQANACGLPPEYNDLAQLPDTFQPNFKFYHVLSEGSSYGRLLGAFHLQKLQKNTRFDITTIRYMPIVTQWQPMKMLFPVYGIRSLPDKLKQAVMYIRIPRPATEVKLTQNNLTKQQLLKEWQIDNPYYSQKIIYACVNGGEYETEFTPGFKDPNFMELVELDFLLPNQLILTPQIQIEIKSKANSGNKYTTVVPLLQFLKGVNKVEQFKLLQHFLKSREHHDHEDEQLKKEEIEQLEQDEQEEQLEDQKHLHQEQDKQQQQQQQQDTQQKDSKLQKQSHQQSQTKSNKPTSQKINKIGDEMRNKGIVNVLVDDQIEIEMGMEDHELQNSEKGWKVEQLKQLLGQIPKGAQGGELVENYVKREIEGLHSSEVNENRFLCLEVDEDEGETFDYGRDVFKGAYEEVLVKSLPYKKFPIYMITSRAVGLGEETEGVLKGDVKVVRESQSQSQSAPKKSLITQIRDSKYRFNLFDRIFLEFFKKKEFQVKLRVYIYRCLSLAAQQQNIDAYHLMAGMDAINSANPFVEIEVGDGMNLDNIKKVSDPERYVENTLSPSFFRIYELDGLLPTDWNMELRIMNKGIMNSMIGRVRIDLEDRLMGQAELKQRLAYQVYKSYFEGELDLLKYDYSKEGEDKKKKLQFEVSDLTQRIDAFDGDNFKIPVEYQELKNEGKSHNSQGSIEMFVEVLPLDLARLVQPGKMIEPRPQEYEVRVIIWETFDIPKVGEKKVTDIMVKCSMDASATVSGNEEMKETDVHNGSEDGNGVFNWRMKFTFRTPCQFPRMKLNVEDFSAFGTNENIGEATISLKRILNALRTQSSYEMPPTKIKIANPNFPGVPRGEVMIQMQILQKAMADGSPVGEAQDEPNENPFLQKPKEGRGLGDFLKGLSFFPWKMILTQILKILLPMIISTLISLILFVSPGILVK